MMPYGGNQEMHYLESERYRQLCEIERDCRFALALSCASVALSLFSLWCSIWGNL